MSYLDYYCELLKRKFLATGKIQDNEIRGYQTKKLEKNLFTEMSTKTLKEYDNSDGDEIREGRINMVTVKRTLLYNINKAA